MRIAIVCSVIAVLHLACAKPETRPDTGNGTSSTSSTTSPASSAGQEPRSQALTLLDELDAHLKQLSVSPAGAMATHVEAVDGVVTRMRGPISALPSASAAYQELSTHLSKLKTAAQKQDHKDVHHHEREMAETSRRLRTSL